MRIIHFIPSLDSKNGGTVEAVKLFSKGLKNAGLENVVITFDPVDNTRNKPTDFSWKNFKVKYTYKQYFYNVGLINQIAESIQKGDVGVIHGIWQYHSYAAACAMKKKGIRYILFPHGMLDRWFRFKYPLKHLKKQLYWILFERHCFENASYIGYTSEQEKKHSNNAFYPFKPKLEEVIPLGLCSPNIKIENAKILFLEKFPKKENTRRILFLGRIHPKKGCDILIEAFQRAFKQHHSVELIIAGEINSYAKNIIKQICESQSDSNIKFTGHLEGEMKWGALASADLFVLPSFQENFGITVVEALMIGCPVMISNQVNIYSFIENDSAGWIFNPDVQSLMDKLELWLKLGEKEINSFQKNAYKCYLNYFQLDQASQKLIKILKSL
jgi:glycosyltransferase involved in cell wall biosynthesis